MLLFVSFRKIFSKDIIPATISSWIKQTVDLCYQHLDGNAQRLHQVMLEPLQPPRLSKEVFLWTRS